MFFRKENKYIAEAKSIYETLSNQMPSYAWDKIIEPNMKLLKKDIKHTTEYFNNGHSVYNWVLCSSANTAADYLQTGEFSIQGTIVMMGEEFLKIYDFTTSKLVEIGEVSRETVDESRKNLLSNIKDL